jgi:hypothetical protein
MAVIINARGTSVPYFKIGKGGVTIYQGAADPSSLHTIEPNDVWIDVATKSMRYRTEQNSWSSSSSPVVVSSNAPTNPDYGTLWYDTGSTYRLYVWNNTQWIEASPRGYSGSRGYTGSQGTTGYVGSQGVIGYTGSRGYTGSQGVIGYTGSQGVIGYTGSQGELGYTGSQGRITTSENTPPAAPYEGQIWLDTTTMKTYVYYDTYWVEVGSSEIGTLYVRNGFTATTSTLGSNVSENINVAGYKSYVLMSLSTSHAAWVRIYSDNESRLADENRAITVDPVAGSGVIAEFITTANQTQKVTPFIFGGNLDSSPSDNLYLRVTNLSGISASINISVLLTRLEF